MSLTAQNLLPNPNPRFPLNYLRTHNPLLILSCKDSSFTPKFITSPRNRYTSLQTHHCPAQAFENEGELSTENEKNGLNLDTLLPILEFVCIASSAALSIGLTFNKWVFARFGDRVFAWQLGFLVGAVAIGVAIRDRQWRRVCSFSKRGSERVNLVERIEKLEEDVRSSATIARVLSRQLEKLGVRFRVTRKALKDPIAEAVSLAQKNSEATCVLAAQEEILEKELFEIQKVLLAMQEQQQKQLELILAIAKNGKLFDTKQGPNQEQVQAVPEKHKPTKERPNKMVPSSIQILNLDKETNNDRA